ncbi:putative IS3 family transposase domain protein [Candidatus Bealeia paramacronuclearis]|uniref:IS66 family insertion sequence element accessory protein TnpA n=1 Tax=Candidatus Bealeia paramacronuclearis TaxID=1921001 RepID=UPI002CC6B380|nr:putative IS3 family transposase domain protein [Candidatus Bealeia paramacronuclearis]
MMKEKRTEQRQTRDERSAGKLKYWEEQIESWRKSGLSQEKFCTAGGLSYSSFKYWFPRVGRRLFEGSSVGRFVATAVVGHESPETLDLFESPALQAEARQAPVPLEIRFMSGERIEIVPGFDGITLQRVIAILRSCHV